MYIASLHLIDFLKIEDNSNEENRHIIANELAKVISGFFNTLTLGYKKEKPYTYVIGKENQFTPEIKNCILFRVSVQTSMQDASSLVDEHFLLAT